MTNTDALPDTVEIGVGASLSAAGQDRGPVTVRLSRELITLLSEQLYTSPSKAIEELVVNSFDADAANCWVFVPSASPGTEAESLELIAVLDDGVGMDVDGLTDLWRVGASNKRDETVARARSRTQIGKFGIGKLATYALASRVTYITSTGTGEILSVTLSYEAFKSSPDGTNETPVELTLKSLQPEDVTEQPQIKVLMEANGLDAYSFLAPSRHWTLVLLEEFKPAVAKLSARRLRWILSSAMPISEFTLFLNGQRVESSKAEHEAVVEFAVGDLPQDRLDRLEAKTGLVWSRTRDGLSNALLPSGVTGTAIVTDKSIYGGKSADLIRSHGFFVRVRERLIAEDDPLFGVQPLSYEVFNRFRADVEVDDLDADLTAPREGAGISERVSAVQDLLVEIFNEARSRYLEHERARFDQTTRREDKRSYVYPRFVERPVADALLRDDEADQGLQGAGSEADESWFYLREPDPADLSDLTQQLYATESRAPYLFELEQEGREARLVAFDPRSRVFRVNADHELSLAFKDNPASRDLLYNLATAEALLEVYLREVGLSPALVGEVLERRDGLFRSLAREQTNSPAAIAASLRDAKDSEHELEVALVIAARALGFVAKHVGNAGKADGIARFSDYPAGQKKITLEAKSSASVPSLSAIDFAGLQQHMKDEAADACLLVAPSYPGGSEGNNAAAAKRARELRISCWTIDQLARVVEALATYDITARSVLDIVLNRFTPEQVAAAVDELLADSSNAPRALAAHMLSALRDLEKVGPSDRQRSIDMLVPLLGLGGITASSGELRTALKQLAAASNGAITIRDNDRFALNTSVEELERRVAPWANNGSSSRHGSLFHNDSTRNGMTPEVD